MRKSNFALRLQPSLMEEARKAAESDGVALNQLINVAIAEKVSALRTEEYFQVRAGRANRAKTLRVLARAGKANPPIPGDDLPREDRVQRRGKIASKREGSRTRTSTGNRTARRRRG
jgi:hypothetical protein